MEIKGNKAPAMVLSDINADGLQEIIAKYYKNLDDNNDENDDQGNE